MAALKRVPRPVLLTCAGALALILVGLVFLAIRPKHAAEPRTPDPAAPIAVKSEASQHADEAPPGRATGKPSTAPVERSSQPPKHRELPEPEAAKEPSRPSGGGAESIQPPLTGLPPPSHETLQPPQIPEPPDKTDNRLTGISRRYDSLECQRIQARHGVRIPAAATILDVDGQRLRVSHAGSLASSPAPILFLARGSHAVCFRPNEFPLAVTIESDLVAQYEAMRKFFGVGGEVKAVELISRAAKTMDVHSTPFLLNFSGAHYAAAGKWDVAERKLRRALCVNPAFSPAHLNLAECLIRRNATDEASREVALADAFNVGNVFGLTGAIREYRKRLKLPLDGEETVDVAGLSYVTTEAQTDADLRLAAILEGVSKYAVRDEQRAKILNNLAIHFADSGRPELAMYHFHHALEVVLHAGEGRYDLARQVFANMKRACRKSGFAEANEYEQMEAMVLR